MSDPFEGLRRLVILKERGNHAFMRCLTRYDALVEAPNDEDRDELLACYRMYEELQKQIEALSKETNEDDNLRYIISHMLSFIEKQKVGNGGAAPELEGQSGATGEEGSGEVCSAEVGARRESEVESNVEHSHSD